MRKLDPSLKKGNWTDEEDALVLAGVAQHGRDWVAVAASLPGRGAHHIQKRYDALCRKGSMRNPWSDEETNRLREAIEKHGTRDWSVVVEKVGRNAEACKRKWHYLTLNKDTGSVGWNDEVSTLPSCNLHLLTSLARRMLCCSKECRSMALWANGRLLLPLSLARQAKSARYDGNVVYPES